MTGVTAANPDELEPVLPMGDVQGNVLPGFNKRHQQILALRILDSEGAKRWVRAIAPEITTAEEVQRYKELRKAVKHRRGGAPSGLASVWMCIAFSASALRQLISAEDVDAFEDEAFKIGMAGRASLLGDPAPNSGGRGAPDKWVVGGTPETTPDILLILAADRPDMLGFQRARVNDAIFAARTSVEIFFEQNGEDLPGDLRGHEHFGFRDGISQPGIRGRLPWEPAEFLTPRILAAREENAQEFARPGQPLVRVGQFLFGYATQDRLDPAAPGRLLDAPAWAQNGSFLVFRRLEQDVMGFRLFVAEVAAEVRTQPGGKSFSEDQLAARIVGRWPSGAPLSRTDVADDPALAEGDIVPNAFQFAQASPVYRFVPGYEDPFPPAIADPHGLRCPIWSHIRKVNPRDVTTEQGSDTDTLRRRIVRRGIPYGDPLGTDDETGARGLLFLSYQTSLTDQFEFLASSWMNTTSKPQAGDGSGHDLLIGQNPARDERRIRTATLLMGQGASVTRHPLTTGAGRQWVISTGGGYFFAPSLTALSDVIAAQ